MKKKELSPSKKYIVNIKFSVLYVTVDASEIDLPTLWKKVEQLSKVKR